MLSVEALQEYERYLLLEREPPYPCVSNVQRRSRTRSWIRTRICSAICRSYSPVPLLSTASDQLSDIQPHASNIESIPGVSTVASRAACRPCSSSLLAPYQCCDRSTLVHREAAGDTALVLNHTHLGMPSKHTLEPLRSRRRRHTQLFSDFFFLLAQEHQVRSQQP